MPVILAYLGVIVIWSTTPLGIHLSGIEVHHSLGLALRMCIGLLPLLLLIFLQKLPFPWHARARHVYYAGGLSLFAAMALVYWAAQYIPSGWIAVIFGLSPLFTSLWSAIILKHRAFSASRLLGMILGTSGLGIIFLDSLELDGPAWLGITGVILSALSQSLGAVVITGLKTRIPAISITAGSLVIAIPCFIVSTLAQAGIPQHLPGAALWPILYLAILGTATGFPLYYYLLKHLSAERIALITLITPVAALLIGHLLNDEIISAHVWTGTACILLGLMLYDFGQYLPSGKKWLPRWFQKPL